MVMVAHGTSVTPFVSVLRAVVERVRTKELRTGDNPFILLYGIRSSKPEFSDYLYKEEIEECIRTLQEYYHSGSQVICAESYKELLDEETDESEVGEWRSGIRMNTNYVQDLVVEHHRLIGDLLLQKRGKRS